MSIENATAHIEFLTGSPLTNVHIRLIHDSDKSQPARKMHGTITELWPNIEAAQAQGYGVFVVVNEGGNTGPEITRVRATFIDADGVPLDSVIWHLKPDFVVQRDASHWHAYWRVCDLPIDGFREIQKRLASNYGTDPSVCDRSRVMRLAGTLHQKAAPTPVQLTGCTNGVEPYLLGRGIADLSCGLPELPPGLPAAQEHSDSKGVPVSVKGLKELLGYLDPNAQRTHWLTYIAAIRAAPLLEENELRELAHQFSRGELERWGRYSEVPPERYTGPEDVDSAFDTMPPRPGGIGIGTLIHAARAAGFRGGVTALPIQEIYAPYVGACSLGGDDLENYPDPMSACDLANRSFPRAEYLIAGYILKQHVNLLSGDGGIGKTSLALNAAVAIAAGMPFAGCAAMQARVLLVLAEDDFGETKHRLEAICGHFNIQLADLPIEIWCLPGHDVTLAQISDTGVTTPAPFLKELESRLRTRPGAFVVLDSLADIASLNESLRPPVNALLKRVLGGLCNSFGATVLLLAHPSKASQADGTHYSGSTAFNAGVRQRLVLEQPAKGSSSRILRVAKANYGALSELELFLSGAIFMTADCVGKASQDEAERDAVLSVALQMIDKGISIVRANGNGQKPKDVAAEVRKKHGLTVQPRRVLDILSEAEREGLIKYRNADSRVRGSTAGFVRAALQ